MNQTLKEQLKEWKQEHRKSKQRRKPQKRRTEVLTDADIKSLMGMDRPIFRKYRGSYRQK